MSTPKITDMFGIDFPLFAFTHCRDVVVAVSKAGGMGVFGALHYTPEQLKEELAWIEQHIDGLPYAVDLVMPAKFVRSEGGEEFDGDKLRDLIPEEHPRFANEICDQYGVSKLPEGLELRDTSALAWSEKVLAITERESSQACWRMITLFMFLMILSIRNFQKRCNISI